MLAAWNANPDVMQAHEAKPGNADSTTKEIVDIIYTLAHGGVEKYYQAR